MPLTKRENRIYDIKLTVNNNPKVLVHDDFARVGRNIKGLKSLNGLPVSVLVPHILSTIQKHEEAQKKGKRLTRLKVNLEDASKKGQERFHISAEEDQAEKRSSAKTTSENIVNHVRSTTQEACNVFCSSLMVAVI